MSQDILKPKWYSMYSFWIWLIISGLIISVFVTNGFFVNQSDNKVSDIEFRRVLQFELPDKTVFKLTLNGTNEGYYDLTESSIMFEGKRMMLTDLKFISDEYVMFNKTTNDRMEP